jgi:hypothetical protein
LVADASGTTFDFDFITPLARNKTMFILPSLDGFSTVMQILFFVGALVGPDQNAKEMVSLQRKLDALTQLAQKGDTRQCDDVIDTIRKKKTETGDELKLYLKARKELHDGVARDLKWLQNNGAADPNIKIIKQEDIAAKAAMLEVIRFHETRLDKLIAGREQEEQAFALLCEAIKLNRRASKAQ